MNIRADIMSLLPDERLSYAMDIIDQLTGLDNLEANMLEYGLTRGESVVFCVLQRNSGRVVPYEGIHTALYGGLGDVSIKIVNSHVHKIRKKTPFKITTECGIGYRFEKAA